MPKGFQPPSQSTQETGHGYQPMAVPDTSPFTEAPEKPEDFDGYGGDPSVTGDHGYTGTSHPYDSTLY